MLSSETFLFHVQKSFLQPARALFPVTLGTGSGSGSSRNFYLCGIISKHKLSLISEVKDVTLPYTNKLRVYGLLRL